MAGKRVTPTVGAMGSMVGRAGYRTGAFGRSSPSVDRPASPAGDKGGYSTGLGKPSQPSAGRAGGGDSGGYATKLPAAGKPSASGGSVPGRKGNPKTLPRTSGSAVRGSASGARQQRSEAAPAIRSGKVHPLDRSNAHGGDGPGERGVVPVEGMMPAQNQGPPNAPPSRGVPQTSNFTSPNTTQSYR